MRKSAVSVLAGAALVISLVAGCSDGATTAAPAGAGSGPAQDGATPAQDAAPMSISISPESGAKDVDAGAEVKIAGEGGELSEVRVTDSQGRELAGGLSEDRSTWTASVPVRVDTRYAVHAWGQGADGRQVEETARFTTTGVERSGTLEALTVEPANGETVGIAQPIIVGFSQAVKDRKTVQDALQVTTSPKVAGAWYWIDDYYVHYRPQEFWPAGTEVELNAKLAGIGAGDGIVGGKNRRSTFTIGRAQVMEVDVDSHTMEVLRDGEKIKTFDVSTGKQGWETRNGTKVIMGKQQGKKWSNEAIDAPEEYSLRSDYAMRVTNSGEFVHDAPWAEGTIGEANTSHGCIGLAPADMKWLFENTMLGDPVVVTGSPKPHKDLTNRIADWNISWSTWKKGNA